MIDSAGIWTTLRELEQKNVRLSQQVQQLLDQRPGRIVDIASRDQRVFFGFSGRRQKDSSNAQTGSNTFALGGSAAWPWAVELDDTLDPDLDISAEGGHLSLAAGDYLLESHGIFDGLEVGYTSDSPALLRYAWARITATPHYLDGSSWVPSLSGGESIVIADAHWSTISNTFQDHFSLDTALHWHSVYPLHVTHAEVRFFFEFDAACVFQPEGAGSPTYYEVIARIAPSNFLAFTKLRTPFGASGGLHYTL